MRNFDECSCEFYITIAVLGFLWIIISVMMLVDLLPYVTPYGLTYALLYTFLGICEILLAFIIKQYKQKTSVSAPTLFVMHGIIATAFALTYVIHHIEYSLVEFCSYLFWVFLIPTYLAFISEVREILSKRIFTILLIDMLVLTFGVIASMALIFFIFLILIPALLVLGLSLLWVSLRAFRAIYAS